MEPTMEQLKYTKEESHVADALSEAKRRRIYEKKVEGYSVKALASWSRLTEGVIHRVIDRCEGRS